ncbi:unnamed protein product [Calypogeia fissa]
MADTMPKTQPEHVVTSYVYCSAAMLTSDAEAVGIDDVSDEIVVQIIQRVGAGCRGDDGEWRSRDLFNLAVCSRRFYQLVEPELYSEFVQNTSEIKYERHFLLFLKRILARPDLAQCLKRLWTTACSNKAESLLAVESELAEGDWKRIRKVVNEASRTEDEAARWIRALELGQWAAIMALLLSVTPNLEELEISEWSDHNLYYEHLLEALERARILQDSGKESPFSMSKLRIVSVNYYDMENGYKFEQVVSFLQLKSVEAFRGDMVSQTYDHVENYFIYRKPPKYPLPKLMTKDLTFTNSVISHHDMLVILGCFPQLERFHYEYGGSVVGRDLFEPPLMMAALEHLKPCLKDLTLVTDEWSGISTYETYPIGSLAGFQKLVSITAHASIMVGEEWSVYGDSDYEDDGIPDTQDLVDAVPPTLESLSLKDCKRRSRIADHIFELVSQKSWRTPALRKLDLGWEGVKYPDKESPRGPILHPGFRKEEAAKLMVECKAAGIEIAIDYLPPRPKYVGFGRKGEILDEKSVASGHSPSTSTTLIEKYFEYPYEGYEEYCEQNDCDPKTGNLKWLSPPWDFDDFL